MQASSFWLTFIWNTNIEIKVRKRAKIRNRYNQAPHLTQDTIGKVTTIQLDITNESQEVTHLSRMDLPTLINWTSPFPFKGLLGVFFFIFFFNFDWTFSKQTVDTLIRRRVEQRLIWVCTIYSCPTNRMTGLYELKMADLVLCAPGFPCTLNLISRL